VECRGKRTKSYIALGDPNCARASNLFWREGKPSVTMHYGATGVRIASMDVVDQQDTAFGSTNRSPRVILVLAMALILALLGGYLAVWWWNEGPRRIADLGISGPNLTLIPKPPTHLGRYFDNYGYDHGFRLGPYRVFWNRW
jgi:hypothetical protein